MGGEDFDDTCGGAGGIHTLGLFNALSSKGNQTISFNVCVKVAHGALSDAGLDAVETQKELLGASGLMLLLAPRARSKDVAEDTYWLSALLQLKQLLQAKPLWPALPLAVLTPGLGGVAVQKEAEDGG